MRILTKILVDRVLFLCLFALNEGYQKRDRMHIAKAHFFIVFLSLVIPFFSVINKEDYQDAC